MDLVNQTQGVGPGLPGDLMLKFEIHSSKVLTLPCGAPSSRYPHPSWRPLGGEEAKRLPLSLLATERALEGVSLPLTLTPYIRNLTSGADARVFEYLISSALGFNPSSLVVQRIFIKKKKNQTRHKSTQILAKFLDVGTWKCVFARMCVSM